MTDTFAMITAANTTLQDPNRVGNGLKSVAVNLAGIKASADTGKLSLNKTAKALKEVAKIDIFKDKKKGKLKDMATIIDELGQKWHKFTDVQKAGISEAIAGKHQAAVFRSLMNNYKVFKKVQSDLNSGKQFKSMQKENEQYVQSLSGQLNRLKETWMGIFNDLFDKRFFAGALKGINVISDAIGKLTHSLKQLGMLQPLLLTTFGVLGARKIASKGSLFGGLLSLLPGIRRGSREIIRESENASGEIIRNADRVGARVTILGSMMNKVKSKTSAAFSTIGLGAETLQVIAPYALVAAGGVAALAAAYKHFHESADEQAERTAKQVEVRRNEVQAYNDQIGKLQELQKEYDKLHGKKDKSKDDLERIKELNNEIAKIKPDLVVGHDKDGNAIIAMTGNVKDLISQLKIAQKEKKLLLQDSEIEDAKSTIRKRQNKKEVGGIEGGSQLLGNTNSINDLNKLHETQAMHNADLEYYEKKRQEARERLYTTTGKQNDKAYKQLKEYNLKIAKENEKFREEYRKNLEEIQKNNKKIGDNLFGNIENGSKFSIVSDKVKKDFDNLKNVFDYSEVQSEDDLLKTKDALSQLLDSARMGELQLSGFKSSLSDTNAEFKQTGNLESYNKSINGLLDKLSKNGNVDMDSLKKSLADANEEFKKTGNVDNYVNSVNKLLNKAAKDGFMDLGNLKKSISEANEELAKTGDFDAYNKRMDELAEKVSKLTGIDKGLLKNLFAGLDTSPLTQADDALNKFLNGYGKSARDLQNNDSFALALAEQKQHIESGLEGIESALNSKNLEYKKQVLIDLKTDENLPKQLDDMIDTLMASGENEDDILRVARAIMLDLNDDGKVDIEAANKLIEEKFGKGKFKITPEIELSENAKIKGVETVISQLKERYDGIPKVVKTVIEAEGITAFNQANDLYKAYKNIPDEVKTDLKNNGLESSKSIFLVDDLLKNLPPEVISNIINNFPDAVKNSKTYDELLKNLPPQVATDIIVNSDPTTVEAIKKAIDGLPMNKDVIISVMTGLVSGNIEQVKNALETLPPEKRVEVLSAIENALQGIDTVEARQLKDKIAALKADPKLALSAIGQVNGTPMQPKNTKVTETGASNVKGKLNNINSTPNKHHRTQATQNGSEGVIGILRRILGIPNKKHTTTAINNGGLKVLSTLTSIMAISPTKRIVVTTVFNTIGKAVNWVKGKLTGAGNVTKKRKTTLVNNIETLNVPSSPSPVPMSTGANTTSPSPTPTGNNSSVPQGATTGAATSSSGISTSQIIPAFNFDIDLLNGMEHELKKIGNELSIIDTKAKRAFGQEKINYLNRQNELYRKQQILQHELSESMRKQRDSLKSELMRKGIYFDGDRAVNDVDNLLRQEQRVKDLEKRTNADKEGKNEALRKEYDAAKESLDKTKKMLQEYANLTFDKIPACSQEWEKLNSQIKESTVELLKSKYELSNIKVDIQIDKFDNNVKRVNNQISILDKEIENAFGNTKGKLIQNKIELIRSQQDEVRNLSRAYNEQARIQEDLLKNQGFIINQEGQVLNPERLKDFAGSDMYSYLKDQLKSYTDLVNDKIPKLTVDIWNLQGEIKKSYEDQLKVTKEVQDKITEVYKKQIEERKKLIDEEVKSKVDALNKEKDAYNKSRKEMDYKNQLEEQQKTINDLQVSIDNASRDTSISGQKKLQELMDKMKEEQKKLQNLVQEKLDQQVNENFEKEEKRLQEAAEAKKNALDEKYSDKNLIQFANNALKTGVFEDIDGNVKTLQSVISDFVNSTKDGMDALGGVIKRDLVSNLELAKESFKEMANIYQNIGMGQFYQNTFEVPKSVGTDMRSNNKSVSVVFNQPLVVADNITKDSLPYLDDMIREAEKRITENIVKSM